LAWHLFDVCARGRVTNLVRAPGRGERGPDRPIAHMANTPDDLALMIAGISGVVVLCFLHARIVVRIIAIAIYIPLTYPLLYYYSFYFVGIVFDDWL